MKVIADLCVIPLGVGSSVSKEVTECQKILRSNSKIKSSMHAYGTNLEGEWDDVFAAIKLCHETLHQNGVARISSSIKVGTRTDKNQSMRDKIDAVETKI